MEREELMERVAELESRASRVSALAKVLSHEASELLANMEAEEMLSELEMEEEAIEEDELEEEEEVLPERKRRKR
jgi:hypothetical protein